LWTTATAHTTTATKVKSSETWKSTKTTSWTILLVTLTTKEHCKWISTILNEKNFDENYFRKKLFFVQRTCEMFDEGQH
jgi:hypothetical protein